jgi:hypothetical protein
VFGSGPTDVWAVGNPGVIEHWDGQRSSRVSSGTNVALNGVSRHEFDDYKSITSLREYIIVSHRSQRIDHHRRLDTGQWLSTTFEREDDNVESSVLDGSFHVRDIYDGIDLEEGTPAR